MTTTALPLGVTVLVGVATFAFGFLSGMQVFGWVIRGREQKISRERRALNEVRRYLRERHRIELAAWVSEVIDKEQEQRPERRWFRRQG